MGFDYKLSACAKDAWLDRISSQRQHVLERVIYLSSDRKPSALSHSYQSINNKRSSKQVNLSGLLTVNESLTNLLRRSIFGRWISSCVWMSKATYKYFVISAQWIFTFFWKLLLCEYFSNEEEYGSCHLLQCPHSIIDSFQIPLDLEVFSGQTVGRASVIAKYSIQGT